MQTIKNINIYLFVLYNKCKFLTVLIYLFIIKSRVLLGNLKF